MRAIAMVLPWLLCAGAAYAQEPACAGEEAGAAPLLLQPAAAGAQPMRVRAAAPSALVALAGAQAPSAHAGLASPLAACGELSARRSKPPRTRSAAGNDPATYKPKTRYDNTPWRFDMEQNGRRMTADEFDAWMKARGVRVAKGAPAVKAQQESKRRRIARAERGR